MTKKIIFVFLILTISIFILNISYATDIIMDLNTTSNTSISPNNIQPNDININSDELSDTEDSTLISDFEEISTTTDYDESADLSISNIINIILIAVGVVLILLGIAIILKLK